MMGFAEDRKPGSEPAYPCPDHWSGSLSKRELFAAMAMQGLLASGYAANIFDLSSLSVKQADALIEELSK